MAGEERVRVLPNQAADLVARRMPRVEAAIRLILNHSIHVNVEPWGVHRELGPEDQFEFRQVIEDSGHLEVDVDFDVPGLWLFGWGPEPASVALPEGTLTLPARATRGTFPPHRALPWPIGARIVGSWGLLLTGAADDAIVRGAMRHKRTHYGQWIEFTGDAAQPPVLSVDRGHITIQQS